MHWIYLSPHLDDAALSCGGLIWEQTQAGETVSIWTVCAGDPPAGPLSFYAEALHARWNTGRDAVARRRLEDIAACELLCASHHHLLLPDCIYRRGVHRQASQNFLYTSETSLFGPVNPAESGLIQELSADLLRMLPAGSQLVCPMALGGHADHRLTRAAAENLGQGLWYYADFPYAVKDPQQLVDHIQSGWQSRRFRVSRSGLEAWQDAVAEYRSQISTFWPDNQAMRIELEDYWQTSEGAKLWRPPPSN